MSRFHSLFLSLALLTPLTGGETNYALSFNGKDDQIDVFMPPLLKSWTITAWVKKEGSWSETENLVGNGWVNLSSWEDYPLCFYKGKLSAYRTGVFAKEEFPTGSWHHVASSWDGAKTTLYVDGEIVATKEGGRPICPAFIGSDDGQEYFTGLLDEITIWNKALPPKTLKEWMRRPVDSTHPDYPALVAYYRFDDQAKDVTDSKGDNKADRKKHYKSKAEGDGPRYVPADNPEFQAPPVKMKLLSARTMQTGFEAKPGDKGVELLKLKINVEGSESPLALKGLKLDLSKCTDLADLARLQVHALGANAELNDAPNAFAIPAELAKTLSLRPSAPLQLKPGVNYFSVTADVKEGAAAGHVLDARCEAIALSGDIVKPTSTQPQAGKTILSATRSPQQLKVMAWNIWHGGIEKGRDIGPVEIADIIRASDADVVTMVETYGSGKRIADLLGFHFHEPGPGANVSILSRFPIVETYKSKKGSFFSTGAKLKLDGGKEIVVWSLWLRYWPGSYDLDQYTRDYSRKNLWIEGDNKYPVADIREILEKDIAPFLESGMPVILGGDFNSVSHLDFTKRAADAGLHNGWEVDLPTAKELFAKGFKDSYREVNPDEVTHPGGTWAAIYKWCQDFRIDYIYYRGDGLRAVKSRTIGEHPAADVLWPGDHGAVLTEFKVGP